MDTKIRYERTALMVSEELPGVLEWWRSPPQSTGGKNLWPKGAQPVMEEFAFLCVMEVVEKELQGIEELAMCPSNKVSDDRLTHD